MILNTYYCIEVILNWIFTFTVVSCFSDFYFPLKAGNYINRVCCQCVCVCVRKCVRVPVCPKKLRGGGGAEISNNLLTKVEVEAADFFHLKNTIFILA